MKIFGIVLSLLLATVSMAAEKPWIENYESGPVEFEENFNFDEFRWLYDLIMPENDKSSQPDFTRRSFEVHTFDTFRNFHHPNLITGKNLNPSQKIEGKITYVGWFKKYYNYSVFKDLNGTLVIEIRVFLRGLKDGDKQGFSYKLSVAERIWNGFRPKMDFDYRFQFGVAEKEEDAHYSVKIQDETRGPYDTYWGRNWTGEVIAHELGHMMGLGDEYYTLTGGKECIKNSLMCAGWSGDLYPYHYYFILRRLIGKRETL